MKLISHRGNLLGRIPEQENHPSYIQAAIDHGYDVEIDVWYLDGEFYLGHDEPQYSITEWWLKQRIDVLWCHAKNADSLHKMLECGLHCFWHQEDRFTLTSRGIPWCYPNNYITNGITVLHDCGSLVPEDIYGVCTDHPVKWKD